MHRISVVVAAVILAFVSLPGTAALAQIPHMSFQQARFSHPLMIDNPYFPLRPGTTLIYRGKSDGNSTYDRVVVTDATKIVSGVTARVVHDKEWESGNLIEDTLDWYAQDNAGNVWYLGEYSTQYENGQVVGHDGSWKAGTNGASAGIIMEANPQVGDSYRQEYSAGIAEDAATILSLNRYLCVTYGCFSHLLKTKETTALEPGVVEYKYYALGIGEIRAVLVQGGSEESHLVKIVTK